MRCAAIGLLLSCACGTSSSAAPTPALDAGATLDAAPPEPVTVTVLDRAHIGSDGNAPDFHRAQGPVKLPPGTFASATLVVDLESPCFPFSKWKDTPPPAGQNWPAECDAFDRNFELALVDALAPLESPGLELVRAITPFGGPLHLEEDVTDAVLKMPAARDLAVTIPSYSDAEGKVSGSHGGWYVTAKLVLTPGAPKLALATTSLFYGDVKTSDAVPLSFEVPAGAQRTVLEYRVTGHGGASDPSSACIGPAEEFCKRAHHVRVDGASAGDFTPWRADCKALCTVTKNTDGAGPSSYCAENPCGATSSVRAPRANWCPGSKTDPIVITQALAPGAHTASFAIDNLFAGGQWRVSVTVKSFAE